MNAEDMQNRESSSRPHMTLIQGGAGRQSTKEFLTTLMLCLLLGGLGAHRFYVGRPVSGILQALTLGGCGLWALWDLWRIATGLFEDGEGLPVKAR